MSKPLLAEPTQPVTQRPSAAASFLLMAALAACGQPKVEVPVSTVTVDATVKPARPELAGIEGGPARPITSLVDQHGTQVDFVQNELIITTDQRASLDALLARWKGQIIDSVDPTPLGIASAKPTYLVRIDASAADQTKLAADFKRLAPDVRSELRVGSVEGVKLLAVLAQEAVGGTVLTPNWLMRPASLERGPINEGAIGTVGPGKFPSTPDPTYNPDATTWPYLQEGGPMDTGVTRAWRALSLAGRFNNRVTIAIFDAGFKSNNDMARADISGGYNVQNPAACGDNPCPWHGTGTSSAAFAVADNGYGAAGPAGPVADPILVQSPDDLWSYVKYPIRLLLTGLAKPRVINISATFLLPALPAAVAKAALSVATATLRLAGVLVVAAAGNDGLNLDERECFLGACWYKRSAFPCELGNVLCVGGMDWNSRNRASGSNYGGNVDLFGPYSVWVTDPDALNQATLASGTSLASPFVAGVAGLVMAANPSLSVGEVEDLLVKSAHRDNGPDVGNAVNAAAAVVRALGNQAPTLRLRANPVEVGLREKTFLFLAGTEPSSNALFSVYDLDMEADGYNVRVRVTSDRDDIAPGATDHRFGTPGTRTLTITATDNAGLVSQAFLTVNVVNTPPSVTNIIAPTEVGLGDGWSPVKPVIAVDSNEPEGVLRCDRVRWAVQGSDLLQQGTGCDNFVVFSEQGPRTVTITATDSEGAIGTKVLIVNVGPRPAIIKPSVSGFVVQDSTGRVLQDQTVIEVTRAQCPLTATATLYNPDNGEIDLSWALNSNGAFSAPGSLVYSVGGRTVQVACGGLPPGRHFLDLFIVTTTFSPPKKVFAFDMLMIPPR